MKRNFAALGLFACLSLLAACDSSDDRFEGWPENRDVIPGVYEARWSVDGVPAETAELTVDAHNISFSRLPISRLTALVRKANGGLPAGGQDVRWLETGPYMMNYYEDNDPLTPGNYRLWGDGVFTNDIAIGDRNYRLLVGFNGVNLPYGNFDATMGSLTIFVQTYYVSITDYKTAESYEWRSVDQQLLMTLESNQIALKR